MHTTLYTHTNTHTSCTPHYTHKPYAHTEIHTLHAHQTTHAHTMHTFHTEISHIHNLYTTHTPHIHTSRIPCVHTQTHTPHTPYTHTLHSNYAVSNISPDRFHHNFLLNTTNIYCISIHLLPFSNKLRILFFLMHPPPSNQSEGYHSLWRIFLESVMKAFLFFLLSVLWFNLLYFIISYSTLTIV